MPILNPKANKICGIANNIIVGIKQNHKKYKINL